jgi:porphobilinogen synthase
VILFPKIADHLKSNYAEETYNPDGLVPRAIQMIKSKFPEVVVCTDVALDPYSSLVRCAAVSVSRRKPQ